MRKDGVWGLSMIYCSALALGLSDPVGAQVPYALEFRRELFLLSSGLILRGYAERVHKDGLLDEAEAPELDRGQIPAFDRWSLGYRSLRADRWSTNISDFAMAVPAGLALWDVVTGFEPPKALARDLVIGAEVFCFASALPLFSKSWLERPRPLAYDSGIRGNQHLDTDADASFFSAHATAAFATAVYTGYTFQIKHPDSPLVPWIWSGMLGAAGTVGGMRIYSGMHFLSDVVMGALVGSACGYAIPRLHLSRPARRRKHQTEEHWRLRTNVDAGLLWAAAVNRPVPGLILTF